MTNIQHLLPSCLYFNANVFSRQLNRLADQAFKDTGISASHASVMLMVYDNPGISPKDLSNALSLSPSTITRFVDALIKKKMLKRKTHGKSAFIYTTPLGLQKKKEISQAWLMLHENYCSLLGNDSAHRLAHQISLANEKL
ncbi:MAG: MarR family transcriptional regulator [Desulfobacteraceae bacterium]|nr:MAG: MarR family transcriptional regulator [Desulfobacteraceae bacterium]